jgi:Ca2+-binding EF-hand superfamily protein
MGWSRDRDRDGDDGRGGDQDNARSRRSDDGDRRDRADRSQNSNPSARPAGGTGTPSGLSAETYARGLIRKYDKNGDNMLQADEQRELNRTNAAADSDKDGVITADELIAVQSGNAPAPPPAPAAASKSDEEASDTPQTVGEEEERKPRGDRGDRGRDRDRDIEGGGEKPRDSKAAGGEGASGNRRVYTGSTANGKSNEAAGARRTYRFTPATERLPSGLSSSFTSRDRNGDGQITMSEFSRTWSKRTVADFRRHDLNGDGVITPKEATKSDWR